MNISDPPRVSIIIVGYGAPEWLIRCLNSVLDSARPTVDHEVIVIDNGSEPPLAPNLAVFGSRIRLITMRKNVGFANACNVGRELATGSHVMLLNPDTELLPGAAEAMLGLLSDQPIHGLVGGRTLTPTGELDPRSCWGQPSWWSQICFAIGLSTLFKGSSVFDPESLGSWRRDSVREVGVITGCLLMAPTEVWDDLGGFDSTFFMYGEDVDLSKRAIASGYRPAITPEAQIIHAVGATSNSDQKSVMVLRGKATLYRKQETAAARMLSMALLVIGVRLRATAEMARGRHGAWRYAARHQDTWWAGWPKLSAVATPCADDRFVVHRGKDDPDAFADVRARRHLPTQDGEAR